MKKASKVFDCIAVKDAVQEVLLNEEKRLGEEEVMRRHRKWLHTSNDPLAAWWRKASNARKPSAAGNG